METAMELIEKDQPVYPLEIVRRLRDQRAMMVQTAVKFLYVSSLITFTLSQRLLVELTSTNVRLDSTLIPR